MPRDVEQMQLLMALSLYLISIKNNPIVLVPATPEMLFGGGVNEEEVESADEYEYEEEEEEVLEETEVSSTPENAPSDWKSRSRVTELGDDDGAFVEG